MKTKQSVPNTLKLLDWEKSIKSLHATTTGAITIKLYRDGKVYVSYGGNTIEDVIPQIVELVSQELSTLKTQVRKEIEEQITKMENSNWLHGMGLSGSQAEYIEANIKASYRSIPSLKEEEV